MSEVFDWFKRIPASIWIFVATQIFLVFVWGVRIDRRVDELEVIAGKIQQNTANLPAMQERERATLSREDDIDRRIDIILHYIAGQKTGQPPEKP